MSENEQQSGSVRLFRITEPDLAELERVLPQLADAMMSHLNPRLRIQWRRVQQIVCDVRWDYGPPRNVSVIPADGIPPQGEYQTE
jgi:hypothetical protein